MEASNRTDMLIVVGVDGSRPSLAALEYAKTYAEVRHGRLRAVSTWSYPISLNPLPATWSPREDAQFQLREASKEVFGDTVPDWYEQTVSEGSAAKNLIDESTEADLLIVGSRGHGGFAGLLLGSVSSQCAAHSQCPVVVVHADDTAPQLSGKGGHAPLGELSEAGSLVVGHDGSANSDDALRWALNTAETLGASVDVVRTWSIDLIPPQFTEGSGYVPSFEEVTERVRRDLIAQTSDIVAEHPSVTVRLIAVLSQPAAQLIERSSQAQMVVVGSRGRGGFAGLLLGSVSAECAAHAHCTVVVVPTRRDQWH